MHAFKNSLSRVVRRSRSLTAAVSLALLAACGPAGDADGGVAGAAGAPGAAPGPRVALLEISGMTCHGCASGVQAGLSELPGVVEAVVSREDKTARVTLSADSVTTEAELRAVVDTKGYKVTDCTWDS